MSPLKRVDMWTGICDCCDEQADHDDEYSGWAQPDYALDRVVDSDGIVLHNALGATAAIFVLCRPCWDRVQPVDDGDLWERLQDARWNATDAWVEAIARTRLMASGRWTGPQRGTAAS